MNLTELHKQATETAKTLKDANGRLEQMRASGTSDKEVILAARAANKEHNKAFMAFAAAVEAAEVKPENLAALFAAIRIEK